VKKRGRTRPHLGMLLLDSSSESLDRCHETTKLFDVEDYTGEKISFERRERVETIKLTRTHRERPKLRKNERRDGFSVDFSSHGFVHSCEREVEVSEEAGLKNADEGDSPKVAI